MPHQVSEHLPDWLKAWLTPQLGVALLGVSLITLIVTAVGVPWFFCRIPPDHFVNEQRLTMAFAPEGTWWRPVLLALRSLLGFLLVLLGVLMLVLPGQGLLTIIVGLLLGYFPGKRRFERWLVSREPIFRGINALRRRARREPLERPYAN